MRHPSHFALALIFLTVPISTCSGQSNSPDNSFTAPEPVPSMVTPPLPTVPTVPSYSVVAHAPLRISDVHAHFDSMVVDAEKRHLFAAQPGDEKVAVLNLSTGRSTRYQLGPIDGIAIDPQENKIFTAGDGQSMNVLDRQSLVRIDAFPLNGRAGAVGFDPDNHRVYVDHYGQSEVWVYDAKTHQEVAKIDLDGQPGEMAYDSNTVKIYQVITDKNLVDVIDPLTSTVTARWPTAPLQNPTSVAVDTVLHRLLVAGSNGSLILIDTQSGVQLASVGIASNIGQIAYDPVEQRVFCASSDGSVSVAQVTRDGINYLGDFKTHAGAQSIALERKSADVDVWVSYSDDSGSFLQCFGAPR